MANREQANEMRVLLAPSGSIDTQGFDSLTLIGADMSTVVVSESADNATFTPVDPSRLVVVVDAVAGNTLVGVLNMHRYVKTAITGPAVVSAAVLSNTLKAPIVLPAGATPNVL